MYIEFDGVATSDGWRGVRGDGLAPIGADMGASYSVWIRTSCLNGENGTGNGETETAVMLAE